uniref:Sialin n=3 Tax=Culex pipiens TaxID=7175 RepID=A0A8D8CG37_CULPI
MILTQKPWQGSIPKRLIVAVMIFIACLTSFMLRVNMSINLLAMVQPTTGNSTSAVNVTTDNATTFSSDPVANYGPRYAWGQRTQSNILGAYFYGYLLTSLPAGLLAERYGPKALVTASFVGSAVVTAVTPALAAYSAWAVIGSRALIGLLAGFVYPTLHNLISRWIPPNERGKVIACISGGSTFGTVLTWPIAGILTEKFGWAYSFYLPALFVLLIAILWVALIEDSPAEHKSITPTERQFIEESFGDTISKTKTFPPYKQVFTSLPYLALLVLHYGNFWGMNFFITQTPKFMNEVLGFKLANAGILSSLPYMARMFSGFFFGFIGDLIRQKDLLSTTAIRKSFCLFSHLIPAVFLIIIPFVGQDPLVCVGLIVSCLGFNGASTITNLVNAQDLAPNFAATLYGFMNFLGTTAGFLAPMLVAYFTAEKNTMFEWRNVFLVSAAIYAVSGTIFIIFGSGKVQKWNDVKPKADPPTTTNSSHNDECCESKRK